MKQEYYKQLCDQIHWYCSDFNNILLFPFQRVSAGTVTTGELLVSTVQVPKTTLNTNHSVDVKKSIISTWVFIGANRATQ